MSFTFTELTTNTYSTKKNSFLNHNFLKKWDVWCWWRTNERIFLIHHGEWKPTVEEYDMHAIPHSDWFLRICAPILVGGAQSASSCSNSALVSNGIWKMLSTKYFPAALRQYRTTHSPIWKSRMSMSSHSFFFIPGQHSFCKRPTKLLCMEPLALLVDFFSSCTRSLAFAMTEESVRYTINSFFFRRNNFAKLFTTIGVKITLTACPRKWRKVFSFFCLVYATYMFWLISCERPNRQDRTPSEAVKLTRKWRKVFSFFCLVYATYMFWLISCERPNRQDRTPSEAVKLTEPIQAHPRPPAQRNYSGAVETKAKKKSAFKLLACFYLGIILKTV